MIIRKIKPEELKRTQELFSIAFEFGADISKTAEEVSQEITTNPASREDIYWQERWAAFEDDDRTMMSYLIAQPFPVNFDGNIYPMAGIGGVASLPQYRRQGGIRGCFEAALPELYEKGTVFSYLYPFSTAYYRRFGYELGCSRLSYQVRLSSLTQFPICGKCVLTEPGKYMTDEIRQIYKVWQDKYNMMVVNEDWEYAWTKKVHPVKDQVFTYVYLSENHTPMGYVTFLQSKIEGERSLQCSRFCYTCVEGLKGLLNLLSSLASDHSYVTFELPIDMDISMLLPEWAMGAVTVKKYPTGMIRAVNVEKILAGARYLGSGQLTLQIEDKQILANTGIFTVNFQDGRAVKITRDERDVPDIKLGINEFSRLILGASNTSALEYMDGITINGNQDGIDRVFYEKPNLILEYF